MSKRIAVIRKNSLDELRVELGEFKGHRFLSIRTFTLFDGADEPRPTKKGITVKPEQIGELIAALQKAEAEAKAAGL